MKENRFFPQFAFAHDAHRRDAQTFLIDLGAAFGHRRAGLYAAHVRPVTHVRDESDQLRRRKYRRGDRHVREMRAAAVIGVVRNEGVARPDILEQDSVSAYGVTPTASPQMDRDVLGLRDQPPLVHQRSPSMRRGAP